MWAVKLIELAQTIFAVVATAFVSLVACMFGGLAVMFVFDVGEWFFWAALVFSIVPTFVVAVAAFSMFSEDYTYQVDAPPTVQTTPVYDDGGVEYGYILDDTVYIYNDYDGPARGWYERIEG